MNTLQKCSLIALALFALGVAPAFAATAAPPVAKPAAKGPEIIDHGWNQRCDPQPKGSTEKNCEIFERLETKTGGRVAEFAIGFPKDKKLKKGAANGVIILPLGILLENGVGMKVGDAAPVAFKTRYCTNDGCFSFVNVTTDLLAKLGKADKITFIFKAASGQPVQLIMNLTGFDKGLKSIQP